MYPLSPDKQKKSLGSKDEIKRFVWTKIFFQKNKLHRELAEISKKCHKLKFEDKEKEIEELEKENDILVKKLFGMRN